MSAQQGREENPRQELTAVDDSGSRNDEDEQQQKLAAAAAGRAAAQLRQGSAAGLDGAALAAGAPVTGERKGSNVGGAGATPLVSSSTLEVKSEENEIHHFAQAGDVEGVRRCLLAGFSKVDEVDVLGCTPVHLAGAMGHTSVVRLLVEEHGAAVDARDGAFCTALHAASEGGHPIVVELLLRLGAEIDARNGKQQTPLHYACGYGHEDAAQQLLIRGASLGARDIKGNTPLHLACALAGTDLVRLLLANGSPLDAANDRGRRPLHLACRNGHLDVATTLLEHGAEPSARDASGLQAAEMIGAARPISQGLRFDLIGALERFQMGDFAMARAPMSSTRSLRQLWRERDNMSGGVPSAGARPLSPSSAAAAATAAGTAAAAAAASAAGATGGPFSLERGSSIYSRMGSMSGIGSSSSFDAYSTGGWTAKGRLYSARGPDSSSRRFTEGDGRVGGRSGGGPRWTVGAAVAGRLEEMRARELGASLRAKVQENEAMKRYVESVTEEMRALQQKVSQLSSPSSPPPPLPPPPRLGLHSLRRDSYAWSSTASLEHLSIAERVARGMYGSNGIGEAGQAGGESPSFDSSGNSSPSLLPARAPAFGENESGVVETSEATATVADAAPPVQKVRRERASVEAATTPADTGAAHDAGAAEGLKGASTLATAPGPSDGSSQREAGSTEAAAVVSPVPRSVEAPMSVGGGFSAERPSGGGGGGEASRISISQLLDAKRAHLQTILDGSNTSSLAT